MGLAIAWMPQEGPQMLAICCPVESILYGGAVGGGKSDWLLGDWLGHWARHGQHCRGILFRRTFPELTELIARSHELYPLVGAHWIKSERTWVMPDGATLRMAYLERLEDWTRYQGHQYTWEGFDEAGLYPDPEPIDRLWGRARSAAGIPCVQRLTANPGGPGHEWLKGRYIDPAAPFTPHLWRDAESEAQQLRVYIPSKLTDNRILCERDPGYRTRISGPAWLVQALLEGNWDITPAGGFFEVEKVSRGAPPPRDEMTVYMGMDGAFTKEAFKKGDYTAIVVWGVDASRRHWVLHVERVRVDLREAVDLVLALWAAWDPAAMWIEGGPHGLAIKPWLDEAMQQSGAWRPVGLVSHMTDKVAKAATLQAIVSAGQLWVPEGDVKWWPVLRNEMLVFDGQGAQKDDQVDAAGIVARQVRRLLTGSAPPVPARPPVARDAQAHKQRVRALAKAKRGQAGEGPRLLFGGR